MVKLDVNGSHGDISCFFSSVSDVSIQIEIVLGESFSSVQDVLCTLSLLKDVFPDKRLVRSIFDFLL